ncbi:MAG: hypothetical protein AVDCRST_MAG19-774, partial [uncultured Thermomicrobiales bacterium]
GRRPLRRPGPFPVRRPPSPRPPRGRARRAARRADRRGRGDPRHLPPPRGPLPAGRPVLLPVLLAEDEDVPVRRRQAVPGDRHPVQETGLLGERYLRRGERDRVVPPAQRDGGLRRRHLHRGDLRRGLRRLRRATRHRLRGGHPHERRALRRLRQVCVTDMVADGRTDSEVCLGGRCV